MLIKKNKIAIVVFSVLAVFQLQSAQPFAKVENSNELYFADPTIFFEDGLYYMSGTRKIDPWGFVMLESDNLKTWSVSTKVPDGMILKKGDQVFGETGFWAPHFIKKDGIYYLSYSADEHVVIASSKDINGKYTQKKIEPIDSTCRNIDSFLFKDDDGKYYLYYVRLNKGNYIWVAEFDFETKNIKSETLKKCFNITQSWEATPAYKSAPVMEGPTVIKIDDVYYMFYSANHYKSIDYAVGYATSDSPKGPWVKYEGNPIIHRSNVKENGVGHGDLFFDKEKQPYYVYHVHHSNSLPEPRKVRIVPLAFKHNLKNNIYDISVKTDEIIIPTIKNFPK